MHITDVELMEPTFWFGRLELNEDTNTELLISGNAMKEKEQETERGIVRENCKLGMGERYCAQQQIQYG